VAAVILLYAMRYANKSGPTFLWMTPGAFPDSTFRTL